MTRDPESLLPLPQAVFHIMLALTEGDRHGYAIMQEVAVRTEGKVRLGPGTSTAPLNEWWTRGSSRKKPAVRSMTNAVAITG